MEPGAPGDPLRACRAPPPVPLRSQPGVAHRSPPPRFSTQVLARYGGTHMHHPCLHSSSRSPVPRPTW
ncbi:hypothetical protein NDU88_003409 [Pleurodeles waltl]|uniref:Uncharacterized protein n=1 Tax=Pleurodeles waltl TaxID=8319 RepID=A0AAV7MAY9_PLEWA|nr:hypothetical protein NDU88_003409 [Pleurodeles waltl]